jgi:hypothetical protein
MPVILVTWEAEIRRIAVGDNPGQILCEILSPGNYSKMDWTCGSSGRAPPLQARRPVFKPQYHKTNKQKSN